VVVLPLDVCVRRLDSLVRTSQRQRSGDADEPTAAAYAELQEENETLRSENRNMFILLEVTYAPPRCIMSSLRLRTSSL
jgi:hypothetical protein